MNHLLAAPILLPMFTAAFLLVLHRAPEALARSVNAAATLSLFAAAVAILTQVESGAQLVYQVGNWPPPFGIVLVADRLSAFLLLLTALLAAAVLLYAAQGGDARARHFHSLFLFQLMGLNGAFLAGDLFNLFVFFEILLIASYCLALQGLVVERLRATLHYAAINIAASSVFLMAIGLLYGITGTLNMAHLAERVALVRTEDVALVRVAGLLLLGVFSIKAALFPLYFWLPALYSNAPAPVAALFSMMTKVGVYAIIRITTLIYGHEAGVLMELTSPWLLPIALTTLVLGAVSAFGAWRLATMTAYLTIASVGTILTAVSIGGAAAFSAGLYYLAHSTIVIALLFLVGDLIGRSRGELNDQIHPGPQIRRAAGLGLAFLFAGATVAGVPPLSGFLGKFMLLQSANGAMAVVPVWTVILATSLLMLVGCARAGSIVLWNVTDPLPSGSAPTPRAGEWTALVALATCSLLLVLFAGPVRHYTDETAAQLLSPASYIDAVLGPQREGLVRPLQAGGLR
ncbi:MAG: monovalent cation/H+ antiporter subunit D [Nitrospira sp.]